MRLHRLLFPSIVRRGVASLAGVVLLLGVVPVTLAATTATAAPAAAAPATVGITGHGYGHGFGMSAVGAYGYAIKFGWDYKQILAHYYGGTVLSTTDANQPVSVRLTALDGQSVTAVVQTAAVLRTSADGGAGAWQSIAAAELTPGGAYQTYGLPASAVCPASPDFTGWTPIGGPVASVDISGAVNGNPDGQARLCQPDGTQRGYRGTLRAVHGASGEKRTVNILPLDLYLQGVVARESVPSWAAAGGGAGMNALTAQAVAARSYVLTQNRYPYAKTCDTQSCQVYQGTWVSSAGNLEDARTTNATNLTSGQVLVWPNTGAFVNAMYSASSGGWTAGGEFPAVIDEGDQYSPFANYHDWSTNVAVSAIQAAWPAIGTYTGIQVTKRNGLGDGGGRVLTAVVSGTAGSVAVTGDQVRVALGLRSDWFFVGGACSGRTIPPVGGVSDPAAAPFTPLSPSRVLDTRSGVGDVQAPLGADCTLALRVAGVSGVPSTATAVAINVTADNAGGEGFLTVYPCGQPRPLASNLNFRPGRPVANTVTVPIGAVGSVCIYSLAQVDVVADVLGWYGPNGASSFAGLTPSRLLDTRNGAGGTNGPVGVTQTVKLQVTGRGGIPASGVQAASLNLTVDAATVPGFVTAWPCDQPRPLASNLNFVPGQQIANITMVPLAADGTVCLYTIGSAQFVVDALGWIGPGAGLLLGPHTPARLLDTRDGNGGTTGPVQPTQTVKLQVAGRGGVPAVSGVKVATLNLTADAPTVPGFVTAWPCDQPRPLASNLNYMAGERAANLTTVPLAADGSVCLYTIGSAQLIADVTGWAT